jgi:hypothetical protein
MLQTIALKILLLHIGTQKSPCFDRICYMRTGYDVPCLGDNDPLKFSLFSVVKWRKQTHCALMSIVMGLLAAQKERIFFTI